MSNFWAELPTGFIGLSPMDGVTDHPCRHIQKKYGRHAVTYTEFTCVEGITHGATRLLNDFLFDDTQRPIVAQIYGHTPKDFRTVALVVCQLGFDGVDINMGCPARNVTHLGSGAALIKTPQLAQHIVAAVQQGVDDWYNGKTVEDTDLSDEIKREISARSIDLSRNRKQLPVSVKTRVGYESPVTKEWISVLLEMHPAAIAVHGRTLNQRYSGYADWEEIAIAKEVAQSTDTIIIGNGDVKTVKEAKEKIAMYHVDGVLLGRATWGDPWVFQEKTASTKEKLAVALEHAQLYQDTFEHHPKYSFLPMRKHLGWYARGFDGASDLRMQLMSTQSAEEVHNILLNLLS